MAFKRKRVYAPRANAFKKRKSAMRRKRRNSKGGPRVVGYTSLNQKDHTFGFRARKTSRRAFKKHLWDSTLYANHWRSFSSSQQNVTTPAGTLDTALFAINLTSPIGNTSPFWTAAGGLVPTDIGVTPPKFVGDITLRGGVWECIIYNQSTTQDIRFKSWLVRTVDTPNFTPFPATSPISWEPSIAADFVQYIGKPFQSREVVIESGNSYTLKGRYRVEKIDQKVQAVAGRQLFLFGLIHNVGSAGAVAQTMNIVTSQNLSFAADAVGTT
ncbi:putative capsid protein [Llama faeces associated circular DNA virus-1]|uniref:Putative capsid protein n=1 Tax=Llama faeces associated circular DNA virus-1 TaxID=1843771 RepID=A0A160HWJ8_9VIRU|nr:putative capsid protein [Llama faeces associated circular DNA virus-1]ANC51558.1 putative capsid protein [Llama faeces associated circular DNA virus-1]